MRSRPFFLPAIESTVALPAGAAIALAWTNTASAGDERFAHAAEFSVNNVASTNASGVGFTVALFFASAAFPRKELLDETKLGALLSVSSGGAAFLLAMALRSGRFSREA